jgi:uncharacterized membrane protein
VVGFYTVLTFSWFLFTNDQRGFALFPRHLSRSLDQLLSNEAGLDAGRTAARLTRDYGSAAITYSKMIYMFIAAMVAVGLLIVFVHRFRGSDEYTVPDHFFALGGVTLGMFGTTLIVRTWGGGRPMMIAFVFVLLFAVVGVAWLGDGVGSVVRRLGSDSGLISLNRNHALAGFALLVALLFVLNSGVASALVLSGSAPSGVPLGDGETTFEYDMSTHAWLIDHYGSGNVYGDHRAFVHTDATAPAIAARTADGRNYGPERPRNELARLKRSGAGPGYFLFLSHNVRSEELNRYLTTEPVTVIREEYRRSRIYTTGRSWIYYFGQ